MLSREEERDVVLTCISLQELGFGLTRATVGRVIKDYLLSNGRLNPFRQGIPGYDWWQGFLRRWPIVSERKLEHLFVHRAQAATKSKLQQWFEFLAEKLSNPQIPVEDRHGRLWNYDEAGFFTDLTSKRVLSQRGAHNVYHTSGGSGKQMYIVMHVVLQPATYSHHTSYIHVKLIQL